MLKSINFVDHGIILHHNSSSERFTFRQTTWAGQPVHYFDYVLVGLFVGAWLAEQSEENAKKLEKHLALIGDWSPYYDD